MSLECRPQVRFEVVVDVGGTVIDHVIAVELTVAEESLYGVKRGIRLRSILSPFTGNAWSLGMLSIVDLASVFSFHNLRCNAT